MVSRRLSRPNPVHGSAVALNLFLLLTCAVVSGSAQQSEMRFEHDKSGIQVPVGPTPRSLLADTTHPYHLWYDRGYSEYSPDSTLAGKLMKAFTADTRLLIFYGAWCGDTHRELPRLMKILDVVGVPKEKVELYALPRSKQRGNKFAWEHDIKLVPTIIMYRNDKELGRIVESPKLGLESDMLEILSGKSGEGKKN